MIFIYKFLVHFWNVAENGKTGESMLMHVHNWVLKISIKGGVSERLVMAS